MLCMRILLQRQYRKKAEGWTRIYYTNTNYKKDGVAILISYKIDFRVINIVRNKDRHFTMINMFIL